MIQPKDRQKNETNYPRGYLRQNACDVRAELDGSYGSRKRGNLNAQNEQRHSDSKYAIGESFSSTGGNNQFLLRFFRIAAINWGTAIPDPEHDMSIGHRPAHLTCFPLLR